MSMAAQITLIYFLVSFDYYCNNNHTVKFFSVKLYLKERFLSDLTPKLV